ncbi:hypothetical protein VNO80_16693 [Phaseolus coccineus]|uniref:Uncharacterized protein n=1 Tax=Phaseolus coccineus TaxID=3886 RepID=A0AAN9R894_PHACN
MKENRGDNRHSRVRVGGEEEEARQASWFAVSVRAREEDGVNKENGIRDMKFPPPNDCSRKAEENLKQQAQVRVISITRGQQS